MIKETLKIIEDVLVKSRNAIVLCSFGKDSMVMLHLIRQVWKEAPVLFFKEAFFPKKYAFANKVILDWDLAVYDFPPFYTDFVSKGDSFEILNWYRGYGKALLYMPSGTHKYKAGEAFLCAKKDVLGKPTAAGYSFPWDTIFIGHKNNDKDPIFGITGLKSDIVTVQAMTLALPIRHWSDADIWKYTIENNVPYNDSRYNKDNGFKEFPDNTYNNDYHPCCFKCLDCKEPAEVMCPKSGKYVKNISLTDAENKAKIEKVLSMANYMDSK